MQERLITDRPGMERAKSGWRPCVREGCSELAWYQGIGRRSRCDDCKAPGPCSWGNCENLSEGLGLCSMHRTRRKKRQPLNALKQQGIPFPRESAYPGDQLPLLPAEDADPCS